MPYQAAGSLLDWLRKYRNNASLSPREVVHILLQAADALQHAHERHVVHQDIKPPNFLIRIRNNETDLPDILLADFGIAKFTNETTTSSQSIRGTPTYMSPEQWKGTPMPASDQYSLAVMAFQFLTGQTPFRGGMEQMMYQHFTMQPTAPSTLNPHISPSVDAVLLRALDKRPEERFPSILQFAQALQQALSPDASQPLSNSIGGQLTTMSPNQHLAYSGEKPSNMLTPIFPGSGSSFVNNPSQDVQSTNQRFAANFPANAVPTQPSFVPAFTQQAIPPTPLFNAAGMSTSSIPLTQVAQPEQTRSRPSNMQKILLSLLIVLIVLGSGTFLLVKVAARSVNPKQQETSLSSQNPLSQKATTTRTTTSGGITATRTETTVVMAGKTATPISTQVVTLPTPTPAVDPYLSGQGTLMTSDALNVPKYWAGATSGSWGGSCVYKSGAYHIIQAIGNRFFHCGTASLRGNNNIYEVQMTILRGDCGGLSIRASDTQHTGYDFAICADGTTNFVVNPGTPSVILFGETSAAIRQGYNQSNTVAIEASGSQLSFYVNKQKVGSVTDSTFSSGGFEFFTHDITTSTEIAFSNAKIWTI
jgi:serine/threonine protein kinase